MSSDEVGRGLECDLLFRMSKVTVFSLLMTVTALGLQSRSDSARRGWEGEMRGMKKKQKQEREQGEGWWVKVHVGVREKLI